MVILFWCWMLCLPTYLALQRANLQLLQSLPCLVAVTDILECLGSILTGDI
jgi:hypothetical protein